MLAVVHPEEEGETMRGREDGRSRLLKMDMVQCTWQVAVLMVQRQEDQDDGEHNACTEVCLCLSTGSRSYTLISLDINLEDLCLSLR
jgi:hypothetical protein